MMMSREASRLAGDFATLVPNANRHRPFSFDGQRWEPAQNLPPWPPAAARPIALRRCAHIAALPAKRAA